MQRSYGSYLSLAVPLLLGFTPVNAQTAECAEAANALAGGSRDITEWAVLTACPDEAPALEAAVRASTVENDSIYLTDLLIVASQVRDAGIADAAMDVAEDPTATIASRIASELLVLNQHPTRLGPGLTTGWQDLQTAALGQECHLLAGVGGWDTENLLPANHDEVILDHIRSVADDDQAPPALRHLAHCAYAVLGYRRPLPVELLDLQFICDRTFEITNASQWTALVTYVVEGTDETGDITILPYEVFKLHVDTTGSVSLKSGDQLVETVADTGMSCD